MKVLAYVCLHYGKDYLGYAIKSVYDFVDRIVVLYCPHPSHGHTGDLRCPESENELIEAAYRFGDPLRKIEWYKGDWWDEGSHRMSVLHHRNSEELILPLDADEIWSENAVASALAYAYDNGAHDYRAPNLTHFWRSFGWCCIDEMAPVRVIKPDGIGEAYLPREGHIYHFGYAQRPEIVRYKWSIHGHKNEMRPGWFGDVFMRWPEVRTKLHPCSTEIWDAKPFDRAELPIFMRKHPFFELDII